MNLGNKNKFILIEGSKDFATDDFKDVVRTLISPDYYDQPKERRKELIKQVATANKLNASSYDIEVRDSYKKGENIDNAIYTCDEMSYILSLTNTIKGMFLFERIDSHIIAKNIQPKGYEKDYCVINVHAKELLQNYLNREKEDRDR